MFKIRLLSLLVCLTLSSCATIFSGTTQRIEISTVPEGATVTVKGLGMKITTPGAFILPRRLKGAEILVTLAGYEGVGEDHPYHVDVSVDPWFWMNIMVNQGVGCIVDMASGAMWKYEEHHIIPLTKQ